MKTSRQDLIDSISDMWKPHYGIRPNNVDKMTIDQLEYRLGILLALEEEQKTWVENRWLQFQATIENIIARGAKDRATALRWMFEASEVEPFDTGLCVWRWGFLDTPYEEELMLELEGLK